MALPLAFGSAGPTLFPAVAFYLVAGPMSHVGHGHAEKALASFGTRAGLGLLGLLVAGAVCKQDCSGEAIVGALAASMAAGAAVDDAILAVEYSRPVPPPTARRDGAAAFSLRF